MLNYRHLHYFWVVTKEGGFARAADRLGMAVQTISAQVRELEKALGHQLLKPAGRGVDSPPLRAIQESGIVWGLARTARSSRRSTRFSRCGGR